MKNTKMGYADGALVGSILLMLGGVWLTKLLDGMGFALLIVCQLVIFPLYSFIVGWLGGGDFRKHLLMPLFPAAFYLAAMWMVYELKDMEVLKWGGIYFVAGYAGLALRMTFDKFKNR